MTTLTRRGTRLSLIVVLAALGCAETMLAQVINQAGRKDDQPPAKQADGQGGQQGMGMT